MQQQHRALILRSNRFLGSSLVDKGLVSSSDLEAANEKFMQAIQAADLKNASLLNYLIFDLKVLDESALVELLVEEHEIGLIDLIQVNMQSMRDADIDLDLCWATSTVPFDKIGDIYLLATCYYLSAPVIKCWEQKLGKNILWYTTSIQSMASGIERLQQLHEDEIAAEEAEAAEAAEAERIAAEKKAEAAARMQANTAADS